ncbi:MAG TPA: lamin tail domain-containing protein [Candidatus Limnocylindria bacterium]|nr:lamin tail domain-containing protein [Candidatus Limnocylindria bacterium]
MGKCFSASLFILVILVLVTVRPGVTGAEVGGATSTILISEIQLNGDDVRPQFVELVNTTAQAIDLTGWVLEYAKPAFGPELCTAADWLAAAPSGTAAGFELSGVIAAGGVVVFEPPPGQINKTTAGALRLLSPEVAGVRVQHDLLGWGLATSPAPCLEGKQTRVPPKSKSLQRYVECDGGAVVDTNNNQLDFGVASLPNPTALNPLQPESCGPEVPASACDGVVISEILPNPKGADLAKEFIELFNPTAFPLALDGCQLGLDSAAKPYTFPAGTSLQPEEYRAFSDEQTGLILSNAAGGEVMLVSEKAEYAYRYPAHLKDDESWASVSSLWQATDVPTPAAPNQPAQPQAEKPAVGSPALAPCPDGKFRNPLTNRCKSLVATAVASAAGLTPCQAGQTRNPATNRCRSTVVAASSALTPCKPGQERNPATNRCRSVLSAATTLKPCDAGEERNPKTNRCRKVATTLASAGSKPSEGQNSGSTARSRINYGILGLVGASAIGYGAYEYRNDFRHKLAALKSRVGKSGK